MPLPELARERHAVLALHRTRAQWIESGPDGRLLTGSSPIEPGGLGELGEIAAAAVSARAAAGGRRRDVVVALGEGWVGMRLVALPPLATGELRAVLARKATTVWARAASGSDGANVCVPAGATTWAATRASGASAELGVAGERWLCAAGDRARLAALVAKLASSDLRPRRLVTARAARLAAHARESAGESSGAKRNELVLLVERDHDGAALWTCAGDEVLQHGTLAAGGGSEGESALITGLLQEARSHVAYARRALRGARVAELVVAGFGADETRRIELALQRVLGTARARRVEGDEAAARRTYEGALCSGPWTLDLTPARTHDRRVAALWAAGALALTLSTTALTSLALVRERDEVVGTLRALQRQAAFEEGSRASPRDLDERIAGLESDVTELETAREGADELADRMLALARAVDGDVAVTGVELAPNALRIEGRADPRPLVALAALERVRRRLEGNAGCTDVEIEPASGVSAEGQPFVLRARRKQ